MVKQILLKIVPDTDPNTFEQICEVVSSVSDALHDAVPCGSKVGGNGANNCILGGSKQVAACFTRTGEWPEIGWSVNTLWNLLWEAVCFQSNLAVDT